MILLISESSNYLNSGNPIQSMISNILKLILPSLLIFQFLSCSTPTDEKIEEYVVIGGGLMGSATAWQLAKEGHFVTLLEKQAEIYTEGSSYGEARIARSSNRGSDLWSYLHNLSIKEVKKLIDFLNEADRPKAYEMDDIYTTSQVTYVGRMSIYDKLLASLIRQKVDYKLATTPSEAEELFNMNLPDDVLIQKEYNQYSGTINPQRLIQYLHKAIKLKKGKVEYRQRVKRLTKNSNGIFEIEIQDQNSYNTRTIFSRNVVSAAGPYSGALLKDVAPYFDSLINPQRVFLAFLKIKESTYNALSQIERYKIFDAYPVINSSTGTREGSFFSMIEYMDEANHPIFKIGGHFQRSSIQNLDSIWKVKLSESEIEWCIKGTLRYFEMLKIPIEYEDFEVVDEYSCVYSLTKSEVPFVTHGLEVGGTKDANLLVLGGMSGVGGKGAMAYGKIGADMLLNNQPKDSMYHIAIDALGFDRLKKAYSGVD